MHTIVFFAEDFAGLAQSAVILARWVQVSMNDAVSAAPRLLVVHVQGDARAFRRQVDTELLVMLRKSSPDRPYSMPEIIALCEGCFRSVTITTLEALRMEMLVEEGAGPCGSWLGFEANFRLMLNHLCEYSSAPFDLFSVTDAKSPLPACSTRYIERFIAYCRRSGIDPVPQLALSFVRESVDHPLCNFTLEEIWKKRYVPLVKKLRIRPSDPLRTRLEVEVQRLARRSQILGDSVASTHHASLSAMQAQVRVFVCFSCLIRPPIHTLSCLHRICNYCLVAYVRKNSIVTGCTYLVRQCPFCKVPNRRQLYVQPAMARARVLVLENLSILSTACLIRDIRARLFGPMYEYIDLVVGVNEGRLVARDVFVGGISTQESLERHSAKKPLSRLKSTFTRGQPPQAHVKFPGSFQVALQEGSNIITSWGEVIRCPNRASLAGLPATITTDFWSFTDTVGIGARNDAASIAAMLVASLFYIQVCSRTTPDSISHELVILCRLEPGPHLMAVLNGLKAPGVRVHYRVDSAGPDSVPLCSDANWDVCKTGQPFTRSLGEIDSLESEVHVVIDSPTEAGVREPVSNSPCIARAVAIRVNDNPSASPSRCSISEIFPEDTDADTVSSEESIPGILHEGPQKAVRVVTRGTADSDWDDESLDSDDMFHGSRKEGSNSHVFRGIDHLQELIVQIRRQNR